MPQVAAETAKSVMAVVAVEQHFPASQRILHDELAVQLLPFAMRLFVRLMRSPAARDWMVKAVERALPGLWSGLGCRKRYIDEKAIEAAEHGLDLVILGAGFDTRAYRLAPLRELRVWEVDQAQNVALKRARLERVLGGLPPRRSLVSMDFERDELSAVLAAHGYAMTRPTLFILEAVSQYLTEGGINETFAFLAKAAPGSRLAFTYVRKGFLRGELREAGALAHERFVQTKTWLFGLEPDEVDGFLGAHGWRVLEHVGYDELARRYVEPTGRSLIPSTTERVVYAERR